MELDYDFKINKNLLSERLKQFRKTDVKTNQPKEVSHRYNNNSDQFTQEIKNSNFIQYAHLYFIRLNEIKPSLMKQAAVKWPNVKICKNILDIKGNEEQVIVGVMYKEMPLKPSILKGVETILGAKKVESFINDREDYLIIEDSSGRVRISNKTIFNNYSPSNYVSGIVCAIKGYLDEKGVMVMEDICFYQSKYLFNFNPRHEEILKCDSKLIAIVSGLQFGLEDKDHYKYNKIVLMRNLLLDLFQNEDNDMIVNRIERLVIAGNTIYAPDDTDLVEKGSFLKQDLNNRIYRVLINNYNEADTYLDKLSHSVKIDLMPGIDDNSSSLFPQQSVNRIMLPLACSNDSVNLVGNPYRFEFEGIDILGTSGQNIDNIRKYSTYSTTTDLLEKTLEWAHIAPTAPDTLRTYPFADQDPMLIKRIPNIYFTSNQKSYESKIISYNNNPVRLLSIPDFSLTGSIIILDPISLETMEYKIEIYN